MAEKINILFQYKPESEMVSRQQLPDGCKLVKFVPSFIDVLKKKATFTEYIWKLITADNYVLYCVKNHNDDVIHKSAKVGWCYKFSFLKKNEYEIGPCHTAKNWRGKGIYPFVLKQIISDNPQANYYMFIDEKNTSSINGVKKAGFMPVGSVKRCQNGQWRRI